MTDGVLDLLVVVKLELMSLSDKHSHPASNNSLIDGVLTGIGFGCTWVETRKLWGDQIVDPNLVEILSDVTTSVAELIREANQYLPDGEKFTSGLFCRLSYRSSPSASFYSKGIRMGFDYCTKLYSVMPTQIPFIIDHIGVVAIEIASL